MSKAHFPVNESARLASLLDLDLDYGDLKEEFKHIVLLVSKTTGMDMSVVNLIDTFTQWTVANHGLPIETVAREDSVCQYTILEDDHLEILDLTKDENHKDRFYVKGDPHLRYYFGVPLKTSSGVNIGSLCVLDREPKKLSPEQTEFLKIIADEIVIKLKAHKTISKLNLARELISKTEEENESSGINLEDLSEKLNSLYLPLAQNRNHVLDISVNSLKNHIQFSRSRVLSALNYPISSAIYLSQSGSAISISLDIDVLADSYILKAIVKSNSTPAPKADQLSPPKQPDCEVKYLAYAEGWHFELTLPVKVI